MTGVRRIIPCLLILMALLVSAGCHREGARVVILRFWNGFTGPDGVTMLRMVKRFNAQNPDASVLMQRMDWGTYYNKLFVAGLGHRAPEVFVVHTSSIERFALSRFVRSVDDIVGSPESVPVNNIDPNVWAGAEVNGKHYGVPLDIHAMGMYYNRRMFRQAGIVDAHAEPIPPVNLDEFLTDCRKLTAPSAAPGEPGRWGFVFANPSSTVYTVMKQYGGQFFSPDGATCLLNCPQNVAALQWCVDLIHKYHVAPGPQDVDAWVSFRQGRVGMTFEGIYMLADLEKQADLDYGGAPVPLLGTQPAVWANSHNLCLRADLRGRQLAAAKRFIKFLSDNSLDWAAGGQIPARHDLRQTQRFRQMRVQSAFARQIPYTAYPPRLPFEFEYQNEFDIAIDKALRGTLTPQQALDEAKRHIDAIIARELPNLSVAQRGEP